MRQFVVLVRIESGGKQNELRPECFQGGQPAVADGITEGLATVAGFKRRIDDVRIAPCGGGQFAFGKGIQRIFETRQQHDARVVGKNILRAVAVVHVEIQNCHAFQAVFGNQVHGGHGHIVDKAKSRRFVGMRVVAGRTDGAKGVFGLFAHHHVHGFHGGAGGFAGSLQGVAAQKGVVVDLHLPLRGQPAFQIVQVTPCVYARQLHLSHIGRFDFLQQQPQSRAAQRLFDGFGALGAFGVQAAGKMGLAVQRIQPRGAPFNIQQPQNFAAPITVLLEELRQNDGRFAIHGSGFGKSSLHMGISRRFMENQSVR